MDFRDIAVRALKTAVQTFLGTVGVNAVVGLDLAALQAGAIAATAAALSVLWNAGLQWSESRSGGE